MQRYKGANRNTGVVAYEINRDSIIVEFRDGSRYLYTAKSVGTKAFADMKALAIKGEGFTTYINQHVKDKYELKIK